MVGKSVCEMSKYNGFKTPKVFSITQFNHEESGEKEKKWILLYCVWKISTASFESQDHLFGQEMGKFDIFWAKDQH